MRLLSYGSSVHSTTTQVFARGFALRGKEAEYRRRGKV